MPKSPSIALKYIGPPLVAGEGVPTPQGWPALDHDEPDDEVRAAKLASPFYAAVDAVVPVKEAPLG